MTVKMLLKDSLRCCWYIDRHMSVPPGSVQFVCHTWIHGIVVLTAPYVHQ